MIAATAPTVTQAIRLLALCRTPAEVDEEQDRLTPIVAKHWRVSELEQYKRWVNARKAELAS